MSFGANLVAGGDLDSVGRLLGGRLDYPFMPTKHNPYVKGQLLEIPGVVDTFELAYTPEFDIELVSVAVGASDYHPRDHWSIFIGEDKPANYILDEIYTKNVPEGVYLMAVKEIKANTPITFRFQNDGGKAKYVWVNYQALRDLEVEEDAVD